jgi:uncharacterized protein (UPF0332 family)
MNNECQSLLAEARAMLDKAKGLNENGQSGAAMKQAYHASEQVAAAYLLAAKGQSSPPDDATYDLFVATIRESTRHQDMQRRIREAVGKVSALREAYEPALLDETTPQDVRQMIDCVAAIAELAGETVV